MKKTFKKYFIPHRGNDHRPHFLREKSVFTVATLVVLIFFATVVGNYAVKKVNFLASIKSAFLVDLANEDRDAIGLKPLSMNDKLTEAASMKANDMSQKEYFAHISPEGKTPWFWIQKAGYNYLYAGENLAVNFTDSEDVENAWMNSPTHKANILNNHYGDIGIATAEGKYKGKDTTFVVQMFGTERKSPVVNTLENAVTPKKAEASTEITETPAPKTTVSETSAGTVMTFSNPEASNGELAQTVENSNSSSEKKVYTNWFERMLVSPTIVAHDLYIVIAAIIIFALVLKIFIEIRQQHPKNIAYGIFLLLLVVLVMYLNRSLLTNPILVMGM